LGDPTRQQIVDLLRRRERDAGEIAAHFRISRPGVSRHLRVLRDNDLVRVRPEAQRRVYSLNPEPLDELDRWLEPYRAFWSDRLGALEAHVERTRSDRKEGE
jgi:DNA-binding transcriptional ArsR family regulator